MTANISGRTVAFLVAAEGIEQVELTEPWNAVERAGGTPRLLSPEPGTVQGFHHLDRGATFDVDTPVVEAALDDYDALVLPGGVANPDALRLDKGAVDFVEADVVKGRRLTSWPSLQTDLCNAGAAWVDEEVVVDGNLITSRKPDDLPAFNQRLLESLA
jgi:protease I